MPLSDAGVRGSATIDPMHTRWLVVAALAAACSRERLVPIQGGPGAPALRTVSVHHDVSPPLSEMVKNAPAAKPIDDDDEDQAGPRMRPTGALTLDRLFRGHGTALTANPFNVLHSFEGMTTAELGAKGLDGNFASDSSGAIGPNHYMHAANFGFKIQDRSGNVIQNTASTAAFFTGFPNCGGGWSDVVILYDRPADRWFVSRFAQDGSGNWHQCFAVSSTPDPTGPYNRYDFQVSTTEFNDYPKFGIWPDAYYMTAQRDKIFPGKGLFVMAFERDKMLANQPAQSALFVLDNGGHRAGMLPADWDGHDAPAAGAPNPVIRPLSVDLGWPSDSLEVWNFHVDWTTPANTTLTNVATLAVPTYHPACGTNQNCVPQPGTSTGLDPLSSGYLMYRMAWRNFGSHQSMVVNHTVDAGDLAPKVHVAVRWYELRDTGSGWSIFQSGTYAPDGDHRWIGSMAMDRSGDIALGYNVSGSVFPSIAFAGRVPGDAAGTFSQESTLKSGGGSLTIQNKFVGWGDYSQVTIDPLDDCTFWYVASYQRANSTDAQDWTTHVGAFRNASCPKATTAIAYTGATTSDYHDVATLSATLTNTFAGLPVVGATLTFQLDTHTCTAVTDAAGKASCTVTPDEPAGDVPLTVSYAGDDQLAAATFSGSFTVTKEETTLTYTGATVIADQGSAAMSAILKEDGIVAISGRPVHFTLGSGPTAQTCDGVTGLSGTAGCTISPVSQPLGPGAIAAQFTGDAFYLPSAASAQSIVFAFLPSGAFVLGDQSDSGAVTYWSATWSTANTLSGGAAPDAFKGFAETLSGEPPACGGTWTTRTGNSSGPPASVPSYMGVLVAGGVSQSGPVISGDGSSILVVKTDAGYGPAPGHTGTGAVVATYCH